MANLLLTPSLWQDQYGYSPPASAWQWYLEAYRVLDEWSLRNGQMALVGSFAPGDVIAGSVVATTLGGGQVTLVYEVEGAPLHEWHLAEGVTVTFSFEAVAGVFAFRVEGYIGEYPNVAMVASVPAPNQSRAFVHTLNAGKGKWSRYEFPFPVDAFSQLSGELFIRTGDRVVKVVEGKLTDHLDGADVGFTGRVQWPWIDAGQPGVTKQMIGFDLVASGSPSVSFGFNQSDLSMFTTPYAVNADTMTGGVIPMPLMSPSFSLRLDFAAGSAWNVRSATIYLNDGKWQP